MDFQESNNPVEKLPIIGITMGDAAGIGAEIIIKSLADKGYEKDFQPVIIGDAKFIKRIARELKSDIEFENLNTEGVEEISDSGKVKIFDLENLREKFEIGQASAVAGRAAAEYIESAVKLWKDGKIDAITTAPINKESINAGGYKFPGHTEFLAELTGTKDFAMSFFAEKLRVVLLSTHVSLKEAIDLIKTDKLVELIKFTDRELSGLLKRKVRIAVAGLNPHASESGMFGNEEAEEILPAIWKCRDVHNINVEGAFSPDTIFLRGFQGEFDAVIACYHDQATIAVKCLSFGASVNVTLGLPLIRTSVDHGTAFDIAGKYIADSSSLKAAMNLAADLVRIRRNSSENN